MLFGVGRATRVGGRGVGLGKCQRSGLVARINAVRMSAKLGLLLVMLREAIVILLMLLMLLLLMVMIIGHAYLLLLVLVR